MDTALLVIDLQVGYFNVPELQNQRARLMQRVNQLTQAAQQQGIAIWHIRTSHSHDRSTWTLNMRDDDHGFLFTGDPDAAPLPELQLPDTSHELIKTRDSAFYDTTLAADLHAAGISHLVLCGVSTHSCIFQTAADAYAHNLLVTIASDAVASNQPHWAKAALAILQTEYRQTVRTASTAL
jgi:nicotinamidase-related amidase